MALLNYGETVSVTRKEVNRSVAYCLTVKDQERRRLMIYFRDTMETYNLAVSRHDDAVRAAKKAKFDVEERDKL